jgi:hypothetical protein
MRVLGMLVLVLAGCGERGRDSPSPHECDYRVTLDGAIPDASNFDGGTPNGGDLPIDECALLCGDRGAGVVACYVQPDRTSLACDPGCF